MINNLNHSIVYEEWVSFSTAKLMKIIDTIGMCLFCSDQTINVI